MRLVLSLMAVAALCVFATPALADSIDWFGPVDGNNPEDISGQLELDVSAGVGSTVVFTFGNDVGIAAHVTAIYFRDSLGAYLNFATMSIGNSAGTTFGAGAAPPNPPGLAWTAGAKLDSDLGGQPKEGLNDTLDQVTVTFALQAGKTAAEVIAALGTQGEAASMIAAHIRSIGAQGGSDVYYTGEGMTPTPEPGTIALLGFGFAGLAGARRRRRDAR